MGYYVLDLGYYFWSLKSVMALGVSFWVRDDVCRCGGWSRFSI